MPFPRRPASVLAAIAKEALPVQKMPGKYLHRFFEELEIKLAEWAGARFYDVKPWHNPHS
jgi:hypothetical protein